MKAPYPGQIIVYRVGREVYFARVFEVFSDSLHAEPWVRFDNAFSNCVQRFALDEIVAVLPADAALQCLTTRIERLLADRHEAVERASSTFELALARLLKKRSV